MRQAVHLPRIIGAATLWKFTRPPDATAQWDRFILQLPPPRPRPPPENKFILQNTNVNPGVSTVTGPSDPLKDPGPLQHPPALIDEFAT